MIIMPLINSLFIAKINKIEEVNDISVCQIHVQPNDNKTYTNRYNMKKIAPISVSPKNRILIFNTHIS